VLNKLSCSFSKRAAPSVRKFKLSIYIKPVYTASKQLHSIEKRRGIKYTILGFTYFGFSSLNTVPHTAHNIDPALQYIFIPVGHLNHRHLGRFEQPRVAKIDNFLARLFKFKILYHLILVFKASLLNTSISIPSSHSINLNPHPIIVS